jgi:FKBP-type peptidyl-prolyl cis-trans isomerase 2
LKQVYLEMLPKPAITVECGNFSQFKKQTIMKKSALIAIVLLCPSFSFAQNIVLKMNLENGKTYNQSTTTVLTITQDVMGQPVEIEMTIIGEMSFLVKGVSDDVYDMELQYERLKMEMKMPQMNMAFDTDTPDEQDMMSRLMTSLKNKPFNIKMNSRGKILEVSNSENLYSGMMEQMDGMDEMQKIQLKTQMEDSFGPETLKGNIEMATAMFPEQPVDIGDSWAVETKLESSMSMILKSDYQLLESTKEFNKVKGEGVAQPVYMVYDKRDRLVLTQDGNQRQDNQWTFTKYDALNRPVLTGTKTISGSRDAVQAAVNDFYEQSNPMYETRSGNWNTGDHGYTDLSYPKGISEYSYLTATYYDDYGFHGGEPAYVPITGDDIDIGEHLPKPKGQATGAKVKVLGDNEFLKSSTYYDNKYRVILTRTGQYNGDHQQLLLSKAITEEGYIYIYVSNESNLNVNVYFDDLKITHTAADMVVQANDYYPFGLTMKPSDFQRDGEQGNKLYNGKELQTDLNLDWLDYGARMYDASIGSSMVQRLMIISGFIIGPQKSMLITFS